MAGTLLHNTRTGGYVGESYNRISYIERNIESRTREHQPIIGVDFCLWLRKDAEVVRVS
jgi:hypothetical protein